MEHAMDPRTGLDDTLLGVARKFTLRHLAGGGTYVSTLAALAQVELAALLAAVTCALLDGNAAGLALLGYVGFVHAPGALGDMRLHSHDATRPWDARVVGEYLARGKVEREKGVTARTCLAFGAVFLLAVTFGSALASGPFPGVLGCLAVFVPAVLARRLLQVSPPFPSAT